jgi:leucyl/phenylalanyl-tRNA---protein transferase
MSQRILTPELLLAAYRRGVFPMAESRHRPRLYWMDPDRRGILPLDGFHVPRSLRKAVRRGRFDVRADTAFAAVIAACAEPRPGRRDTWITAEIERAYAELHALGHAHSVECWEGGALVGGLYGVAIGAAFFGESMFSRATDASKVALVHLVARLAAGGFRLLDTQFITQHLARFGAVEIERGRYLDLLERAVSTRARFPRDFPLARVLAYLQSTSQTS